MVFEGRCDLVGHYGGHRSDRALRWIIDGLSGSVECDGDDSGVKVQVTFRPQPPRATGVTWYDNNTATTTTRQTNARVDFLYDTTTEQGDA